MVVVRHGQTAWNAEGRAQGHADVGPRRHRSGTGRGDGSGAGCDGSHPAGDQRPARARETAAFLEKATGLTAVEDARWREYDLGERTGLTLAEFGERIGVEYEGWWDVHAHVAVPGAETRDDLAQRVLPAFEEVLERLGEGETAVVVTHGASLRVALATILGWPLECANGIEAMRNCAWAMVAETGAGRLRLS